MKNFINYIKSTYRELKKQIFSFIEGKNSNKSVSFSKKNNFSKFKPKHGLLKKVKLYLKSFFEKDEEEDNWVLSPVKKTYLAENLVHKSYRVIALSSLGIDPSKIKLADQGFKKIIDETDFNIPQSAIIKYVIEAKDDNDNTSFQLTTSREILMKKIKTKEELKKQLHEETLDIFISSLEKYQHITHLNEIRIDILTDL